MPHRHTNSNCPVTKRTPNAKKLRKGDKTTEKQIFFGNKSQKNSNATYAGAVVLLAAAVYLSKDYLAKSDIKVVKHNHSSTGGWRSADDSIRHLYDTDYCNIERRNASDLTVAEFEKRYRYKQPVIVRFSNGARDWINPDEWTVESLKKAYGQKWVVSGNGREIVRHGGSGYVESSFTEYVDRLMSSNDDIGEPL